MNRESVAAATAQALIFLERVRQWQEADQVNPRGRFYTANPRESGAVRRASLDLTRALAAMRKPG